MWRRVETDFKLRGEIPGIEVIAVGKAIRILSTLQKACGKPNSAPSSVEQPEDLHPPPQKLVQRRNSGGDFFEAPLPQRLHAGVACGRFDLGEGGLVGELLAEMFVHGDELEQAFAPAVPESIAVRASASFEQTQRLGLVQADAVVPELLWIRLRAVVASMGANPSNETLVHDERKSSRQKRWLCAQLQEAVDGFGRAERGERRDHQKRG